MLLTIRQQIDHEQLGADRRSGLHHVLCWDRDILIVRLPPPDPRHVLYLDGDKSIIVPAVINPMVVNDATYTAHTSQNGVFFLDVTSGFCKGTRRAARPP